MKSRTNLGPILDIKLATLLVPLTKALGTVRRAVDPDGPFNFG
jgi:hypothetical protein